MNTVATHDGRFHADEVFAIAILSLCYPKLKWIRTRDQDKLKKTNARVDVGYRYNPKTNDYDHHQKDFNLKRKNGIPYASAGLIWKFFGHKLTKSEESFLEIDKKLIQPIDANDVGKKIFSPKEAHPYTLELLINSFNPTWSVNKNYDARFEKVVDLAKEIIKNEIRILEGLMAAKNKIYNLASKTAKEYIVLDMKDSWEIAAISVPKLKFVIYPHDKKQWCVYTIKINDRGFKARKQLPKKWAGLAGKDLAKVTGVPDSTFCHTKRFVVLAESKEGAIKLAELALRD